MTSPVKIVVGVLGGLFLYGAVEYVDDYLTTPDDVKRHRGKRLYQQRCGDGNCGKYALLHALQFLGVRTTMKSLYRKQGLNAYATPLVGTDAETIHELAVSHPGIHAEIVRGEDSRSFKASLDDALGGGRPIILSVDDGEHWVAIVGLRDARYRWVDSADDDLHGTSTWRQLKDWMDSEGDYEAVVLMRRRRSTE